MKELRKLAKSLPIDFFSRPPQQQRSFLKTGRYTPPVEFNLPLYSLSSTEPPVYIKQLKAREQNPNISLVTAWEKAFNFGLTYGGGVPEDMAWEKET